MRMKMNQAINNYSRLFMFYFLMFFILFQENRIVYSIFYSGSLQSSKTGYKLSDTEYYALYDFYTATHGPEWTWYNKSSGIPWNFSDPNHDAPCTNWQGIQCDCTSTVCHIQQLELSQHNLSGTLPETLSDLNYLTYLALNFNNISGTIPEFFQNFTYLESLQFKNNYFYGSIPSNIGNASSLQYLDLRTNFLSGTLPESLYLIQNLSWLLLDQNHIRGSLSPSIALLTNLTIVTLFVNDLSGSIPSTISACHRLSQLDISYNNLSSTLPEEVYDLKNLQTINFSSNNITGTISSKIGNLEKLRLFYGYYNSLYGTIPETFYNPKMTKLWSVDFDDNLLSGTLSANISKWKGNIQSLFLGTNSMTGTLPDSIGNCSLIFVLEFNINFFHGNDLETKFSNLHHLTYLDVSVNQFSGNFMNGTWPMLLYLYAHEDFFIGTVPDTYKDSQLLYYFDIAYNFLHGEFPYWIYDKSILTYLNMTSNFFHGSINESIGFLTALNQLSLNSNEFTGTIPSRIGDISSLTNLLLNDNQFTGKIPETFASLFRLTILFLHNNKLTGTLSKAIIGLPALTNLDISNNQFTGALPEFYSDPIHNSSMKTFAAAANCFSGTIPENICQLETLTSLSLDGLTTATSCRIKIFHLNLFNGFVLRRFFSKGIPLCLFNMPNLETLHVSGNGIKGTLPSNLQITSTLNDLVLSHNQLSGEIPNTIQQRAWSTLDLSYNRFTGELNQHNFFHNYSIDDVLTLENNRLSGAVPSSVINLKNINILNGNLFSCSLDHSNLPSQDPKKNGYSCGSDVINTTIFIWIGFAVILYAILFALIFYRNYYISSSPIASNLSLYHYNVRLRQQQEQKKDGIELRPTLTSQSSRPDELRDPHGNFLLHGVIEGTYENESHSNRSISRSSQFPDLNVNFYLLCYDFIHELALWRQTFLDELTIKVATQPSPSSSTRRPTNPQNVIHIERHEAHERMKRIHSISETAPPIQIFPSIFYTTPNNNNNGAENQATTTADGQSSPVDEGNASNNPSTANPAAADETKQIDWDSFQHNSLIHLNIFLRNIRRLFFIMTMLLIFFYLPIYGILSHFYRIYQNAYAWALSSVILSGKNAALALLILFSFILILFMFLFKLLIDYMIGIEDGNIVFKDLTNENEVGEGTGEGSGTKEVEQIREHTNGNDVAEEGENHNDFPTTTTTTTATINNTNLNKSRNSIKRNSFVPAATVDDEKSSRANSASGKFDRDRIISTGTTLILRSGTKSVAVSDEIRFLNKISLVIVGLINFIIMILTDIFYVYIVIHENTTVIIFAEVFLALLKVGLNSSIIWALIPRVRKFLLRGYYYFLLAQERNNENQSSSTPPSLRNTLNQQRITITNLLRDTFSTGPIDQNPNREKLSLVSKNLEREMMFYHYTSEDLSFISLTILLNNIIFPAIAIFAVSSDCFTNLLFAAPRISSSYSYNVCDRFFNPVHECVKVTPYTEETSYTPPFIYSYQCAGRIVQNYASVYILMATFEGIIQPLFKLFFRFYYDYLTLLSLKESENELLSSNITTNQVDGEDEEGEEDNDEERNSHTSKARSNPSNSFGGDQRSTLGDGRGSTAKQQVQRSYRIDVESLGGNRRGERYFDMSYRSNPYLSAIRPSVLTQTIIKSSSKRDRWISYIYSLVPYNLRDLQPSMTEDQKRNLILFDKNRLSVRISAYLMVYLTFGVLFPPLTVIICIAMFNITIYEEIIIGRLLFKSFQFQFNWYRRLLMKNCYGISNTLKYNLWLLVPIPSIFFAYIIFDTWADTNGWTSALKPTLVMVILPLVLLIVLSNYQEMYAAFWSARDYFFSSPNHRESMNEEREKELPTTNPSSPIVDQTNPSECPPFSSSFVADHSESHPSRTTSTIRDESYRQRSRSSSTMTGGYTRSLSVGLEKMLVLPRHQWSMTNMDPRRSTSIAGPSAAPPPGLSSSLPNTSPSVLNRHNSSSSTTLKKGREMSVEGTNQRMNSISATLPPSFAGNNLILDEEDNNDDGRTSNPIHYKQ